MMTLYEAARLLGGRPTGVDVRFGGVSTDTRMLRPGELFVALRGERFDAHDFLAAAGASGAAAALVEREPSAAERTLPALIVPDTRLALGRLATHWRARHDVRLVAVTGSSGKTTVKEMLALVLREAGGSDGAAESAVLATRGNLNNDIGVPLMLLELTHAHRYAVIEMGMNHPGEIGYLSRLALPEVALINNAGRAHIEFLGSEEAIARAKGEIFEGLCEGGTAIINADERYAPLWRELAAGRRVIEFGLEHPAQVSAVCHDAEPGSEMELATRAGRVRVRLAAPGVHNVRNALAAAAAASALGIEPQVIAAGLARYRGVKGRLEVRQGLRGACVIDDTYNANPESVRAALAVLAARGGRRLFVFGDMGELGADAPRLHAEVGEAAKAADIERMFAIGVNAARAAEAFAGSARHYAGLDALLADVTAELAPGVTVLVKGSRFMRMERVVAALVQGAQDERPEGERS
jgi:UDP-N-acetylmuramoyl-tripeptide--D-alanyl-D-alanine ligase